MNPFDFFQPTLKLSIVLPAAILCYLPMKGHLNGKGKKIALWGIPALLLWTVTGGAVCCFFKWNTNFWLLPSLVLFALFYCRTVSLPRCKSMNVFLGVCGVFSSIGSLAIPADALLFPKSGPVVLSPGGAAVYVLLCWLFLGILWYPATHAARWLMNEMETSVICYIFWILPVIFLGLNVILRPQEYSTLYTNRVMTFYPFMVLALLAFTLLFYALFYLMTRGLAKNIRLSQENRILQMQLTRYHSLQKSIEETRRARHDLRQHFQALQGYVESGDLSKIADYVNAYGKSLPSDTITQFCKNYAVNAILHYYREQAVQQQIHIEISVQMQEETVIPEPEFCSLLGNLLENAIDACASSKPRRIIRLYIRQQENQNLYLTLDNTSDSPPVSSKERFLSSRHEGFGVGTESVRIIAQRYNGDARFEWKNGMFFVSVMLAPQKRTRTENKKLSERIF